MTSFTHEFHELQEIDLRARWKHEAHDFTNWLAEAENLSKLAEAVDMELKLEGTEVSAGRYRIDILAVDQDDELVIIENQLEATNHDHLGKIITYAADKGARSMVWVVPQVQPEHVQAVNWLNDITSEDMNFFLVQLRVLNINGSEALDFNVIARPNEVTKVSRYGGADKSETGNTQLRYWEKFTEIYRDKKLDLVSKISEVYPQHYCNIYIKGGKRGVAALILKKEKKIGCELYILRNEELYNSIYDQREVIEQAVGQELVWLDSASSRNGSSCRIQLLREADYIELIKGDNEEQLSEIINWQCDSTNRFVEVLAPWLREN